MQCCSLSSPSSQVESFGRPSWRRLVEAVQDPVGGNNLALAQAIATEHPSLPPLNWDGNFSFHIFESHVLNGGRHLGIPNFC